MIAYKHIESTEEYNKLSKEISGIFYFTHNTCQVGESVKDKVLELSNTDFPSLEYYFIDVDRHPELAGQNSIFAYPTVLIIFEGQEFFRLSRSFSIEDLKEKIARPYEMLFS